MIDITECDENDLATWDMICSGNVKGCFQIEGSLGVHWSKELKPRNMDELAALISVIRPGTLKARLEGKSMTQHYSDRKAGVEEVQSVHESIDSTLAKTYGVIIYQETAMKIAQLMAGFDLIEADVLRKAIGKKNAKLMQEVRLKFIEGAIKSGISQSKAEEVFDIVEKSSRYSFNKCLSPDTVVITEDGEKMLGEIKVGDKILAPNGDQDEFVEILDVIDSGEKEVYEVETEDGKTIICSIDHEFLCSDGKKHPLFVILHKDLEIMCID